MAETEVQLERLYDKIGSMYKLVVLASKRALELNAGGAKLTEADSDKVSLLALREIAEGRVSYKSKSGKE